ncbi:pickpocket protein 28-like isoform X2 [Arctopsyche grandis]|uniref:pickpocket protein 28-like isoform X2 n=1 Tax=Arctopsyche grandis TaxID=121162 RepID=UPI00406DA222
MDFVKKVTEGPKHDRIWWSVMFGLSVAACSHLILQVWVKWNQSPVIVSFAETSTPVWQVPFPAITICSETKARQSIYNFTEIYHRDYDNLTEQEILDYEAISLVCENHLLQTGNKFTDHKTIDLLKNVAPQFEEMMWHCKWKSKIENCSKIFSPVMTEEGLCFSFNMLDAEELFRKEMMHKEYHYLDHGRKSEGWTLDRGYPKNLPLDTYPVRGTGSGAKAGLVILLRAYNYDLDYLCRGPVQGFKILLHSPTEVPRVSQQYFRVPLSQEVIAAIKPNMMTTSEGLKDYDPERRQCFFPYERKLKFFKVYTQRNCELECLTNYTMLQCSCVTFSMPRDPSMPICSAGSVKCAADAQDELLTQEIVSGLSETKPDSEEDAETKELREGLQNIAKQCNCLPACTSINYDVEVSQADFNWQKLFIAFKANFSELPDVNMARMVLFFKESQFITSRRSELYGQTDFLANCGGLLGLFLGFSILSLIEIVYFITLRAFCNLKSKISGKKTKSQDHRNDTDHIDVFNKSRRSNFEK